MMLYVIDDGSMVSIGSCGMQSFVALRELSSVPVQWSDESESLYILDNLTRGARSCPRYR